MMVLIRPVMALKISELQALKQTMWTISRVISPIRLAVAK